ncbi:MAG: DUF1499 domain-containing protein [Leptolyngbyaceae cyanobacterium bins.302]|nr:DUF1499 domain-containing protein [Leptolyngbyaceae cyanobacterium bins.302]
MKQPIPMLNQIAKALAILLTSILFAIASVILIPISVSAQPMHQSILATSSLFAFSGKRPTSLGVTDGALAPCPASPNCVSSQSQDGKHRIEPLSYEGTPAEAMQQLQALITDLPRTEIIEATDNYLYVEFTSSLMGFVDDVEFYIEPDTKLIQVRSASRLGESDLGVNRKRIEAIRKKFNGLA